jgi:hypothetical protein
MFRLSFFLFFFFLFTAMHWEPVGIAMDYEWGGRVSVHGLGKSFSLLHRVQTGSWGGHQVSYPMVIGVTFPVGSSSSSSSGGGGGGGGGGSSSSSSRMLLLVFNLSSSETFKLHCCDISRDYLTLNQSLTAH